MVEVLVALDEVSPKIESPALRELAVEPHATLREYAKQSASDRKELGALGAWAGPVKSVGSPRRSRLRGESRPRER